MRCKQCKQKFEPKWFNQKYCLVKDECIKHFAEQTKLKAWKEKKVKTVKELMTVQDWIKIAQTHFNSYIRLRDKGQPCISCQKTCKKENAGHFYNANNHWLVRFDESNVHLQCEYCNTSLHGNLLKYRENLIKKIGYEELERITQLSNQTRKFTVDELKQIIETYKEKLKNFTSK